MLMFEKKSNRFARLILIVEMLIYVVIAVSIAFFLTD